MSVLPVLALVLAAGLAGTPPLDVETEAYRAAARRGDLGAVTGRALTDGPSAAAAPQPATDVAVTLVPRSGRLLDQLQAIRARARRDLRAYRESARAVVQARQAWERELWQAGAAELVRFTAVDPDGRFVLEALPAGNWLLIAQRAVFVPKESPAAPQGDREAFRSRPRFKGYYAVTIWVKELTIGPAQWMYVELADRNAWMTALAEERERDAGR